ncbi:hypothetical protein [Roseisolibacter sp. H3M3-2]|uniref:hypothetical protein n=1 Tax=Roseisolibacter sp. H3M3-2 TaxID=3031323 RepID=UPI0023D9CEE9|nr:hypothetical protein [Roseisolibacter sp. H3M3-2]MDF1504566.1 hypothetical protein [Roseisolibacter sp. H3M3-2]
MSLPHPATPARDFRGVQRRLGGALRDGLSADGGAPLELRQSLPADPPRLAQAALLEGHAMRAVRVEGEPASGFAAFVDGVQRTRVLGHDQGLPVVHGTVAAVVRVRHNRRFSTWTRGFVVDARVYAPCAWLAPETCAALRDADPRLVDTTRPDAAGELPAPHPLALLDRALSMVKEDREVVEKHVAETWCRVEGEPLFVDGGIQESELVATAPCVAGVVKSHRTLYAEGEGLRTVLGLRRAQRSTVFRVQGSRRTPVASWYLRLRDPAGHDPMWGLVRVEAALLDGESREALTARADRLSRWILAEVSPVALPDARWDRMAYGIYDCERFLRAVC